MPTAPRAGSGLIPLLIGAAGTALSGDDTFAGGFASGLGAVDASRQDQFGNELQLWRLKQQQANRVEDNNWRSSEAGRDQGNLNRSHEYRKNLDLFNQEQRTREYDRGVLTSNRDYNLRSSSANAAAGQRAAEQQRIAALEAELIAGGMPPGKAAVTARTPALLKAHFVPNAAAGQRAAEQQRIAALEAELIAGGMPPGKAAVTARTPALLKAHFVPNAATTKAATEADAKAQALADVKQAMTDYHASAQSANRIVWNDSDKKVEWEQRRRDLAQKIARIKQPSGILTDNDIKIELDSIPTPGALIGDFETRLGSLGKLYGGWQPPKKPTKKPTTTDVSDAALDAYIKTPTAAQALAIAPTKEPARRRMPGLPGLINGLQVTR